MTADRAVQFLLSVQRFIRAVETVFVDTVSMVIPWLAPLVPAYLAHRSMTEALRFPAWLAGLTAGVIELLGLATINTAFSFWSYNREKRKIDPRSPVPLAVIVSMYYLAVVLTVNIILDEDPLIFKAAKGLLSSISVVGGVTIALRASHSRRLQAIDAERRDRSMARVKSQKARRYAKFDSGLQGTPIPLESANEARHEKREAVMQDVLTFCRENPRTNISAIAREVGRSRTSIYDYLEELKAQGKIKANGHGIEVL